MSGFELEILFVDWIHKFSQINTTILIQPAAKKHFVRCDANKSWQWMWTNAPIQFCAVSIDWQTYYLSMLATTKNLKYWCSTDICHKMLIKLEYQISLFIQYHIMSSNAFDFNISFSLVVRTSNELWHVRIIPEHVKRLQNVIQMRRI